MRPRTYQIHVASQNVDQLRELIQAILPQPIPYPRDAIAVVTDPLRRGAIGRTHRTKLEQPEMSPPLTGAFLDEEHRAGRIQFDGQSDQAAERREDEESDCRSDQTRQVAERQIEMAFLEVPGGNQMMARREPKSTSVPTSSSRNGCLG
jgi:hypothetical protein